MLSQFRVDGVPPCVVPPSDAPMQLFSCRRKLYWKPMKDLVGLPATSPAAIAASATMTPAKVLEVPQAEKVSA